MSFLRLDTVNFDQAMVSATTHYSFRRCRVHLPDLGCLLQYTKCALQYELISFITMATKRVPDLPIIISFSGHLWYSILIFANCASYALSSKPMNMLARDCGLVWHFSGWKSSTYWNQVGGDWKRMSCHRNWIFIVISVCPGELLAYQVSMVCAANWPR